MNPILDRPFWGCSHMAGGGGDGKKACLPKISYTYPTMMKRSSYTLPKEDPKNA